MRTQISHSIKNFFFNLKSGTEAVPGRAPREYFFEKVLIRIEGVLYSVYFKEMNLIENLIF